MTPRRRLLLLAGAAVIVSAAAPNPPRLGGTVVDGARRLAIFMDPAGNQIVAEGDTVGPYTVRSVRPGLVELDGPQGHLALQPGPDPAIVRLTPAPGPLVARDPITDK